jgi:hypothetical protein
MALGQTSCSKIVEASDLEAESRILGRKGDFHHPVSMVLRWTGSSRLMPSSS